METKPEDCYVATTCLGKVTKKWQTSTVQGGTYQSLTFQIAKRNRGKSTELKTWVNKFTHQNTGKVYQIGNKLSPQKYSAVVKAHQLATLMLQDAVTALETKTNNKLYTDQYTMWFGGTSTCKTQVLDNFKDFLRQAKDEEFFYQVLPDELGKEGWMAVVDGMLTGKEQHFINLYNLFFTAKDKNGRMPQNEYQAMTILHEITHDVAGTRDLEYDTTKCHQLTKKALKGVTKAADNAENYALYATAVYNLLHPVKSTTTGRGKKTMGGTSGNIGSGMISKTKKIKKKPPPRKNPPYPRTSRGQGKKQKGVKRKRGGSGNITQPKKRKKNTP